LGNRNRNNVALFLQLIHNFHCHNLGNVMRLLMQLDERLAEAVLVVRTS
jgi:hypothetical protein